MKSTVAFAVVRFMGRSSLLIGLRGLGLDEAGWAAGNAASRTAGSALGALGAFSL